MDLWHPDAEQVRAPAASWGSYASGYPFRGVLHTTETDAYTKSTSTYFGHNYWPHATIGVVDGKPRIWQHIPINRAARALKNAAGGVETNNACAVQCEIVARAHNARDLSDVLLAGVESWMRFVEGAVGVQRHAPEFFGDDAGFTVASVSARQRMSATAWREFNGWCGHQHVPENDHWDPGAIKIARLLEGDEDVALSPQEHDMLVAIFNRTANLESTDGFHQTIERQTLAAVQSLADKLKDPSSGGGVGEISDEDIQKIIDETSKGIAADLTERLKA